MASGTDETRTLTPALLGLVWSAMFGFSGFFLSYSTMVSIGVADGLSTVTGGAVLTTMMVGVIAVQPFAPRLGERLGLRAALLIALGLQLLGQVLGLVVGPPLLSLVLAGISGGMGFGLFVVLANAAVPGTVSAGRLGRALGIFGGVTSLAAAVGAPVGLWLIGVVPEWSFRLVACSTLLLAVPTLVRFLPGRTHPPRPPRRCPATRWAAGRCRGPIHPAGQCLAPRTTSPRRPSSRPSNLRGRPSPRGRSSRHRSRAVRVRCACSSCSPRSSSA
ncbi:MFS transporter [Brevibacterium casei]|nr:MFS transporter [Brevibacterium casei]